MADVDPYIELLKSMHADLTAQINKITAELGSDADAGLENPFIPPPPTKRSRSETESDHEDERGSASDKVSRYAKVPKPGPSSTHSVTPAVATEVQTVSEALTQLELRWPEAKAVEAGIAEHVR